MSTVKPTSTDSSHSDSSTVKSVSPQDAHDAMIYRNGVLDYDAHDDYLRFLGYEYLALPCNCGGSDDDGHMPHCGWGKYLVSQEHPKEADVLGRSASAVAERLQEGTATNSQLLTAERGQ